MTRAPGSYLDLSRRSTIKTDAPRVDIPVPGHYKRRLAKGAPYSVFYIAHQVARDPDSGEILDRSPHWIALVNGEPVDVFSIWPDCSGEPISEDEYRFLLADHRHAVRYRPDAPEAKPRERVDLHTLKPIF